MAVKIRLLRVGKKKQPYYRVVVADARSPRDGRIIERIGRYAPLDDPSTVEIDADKALDWLSKGAQPTEAVQKLLETSGVWDQFTAARPTAVTASRKRIQAHTVAAANKPEPAPEPAPESTPAPAAAEAAEATSEAPAPEEAPPEEAPAAEEAPAEEEAPPEEAPPEEAPAEEAPAEVPANDEGSAE